jgi:hypothetical protein
MANPFRPGTPEFIRYQIENPEPDLGPVVDRPPPPPAAVAAAPGTAEAIQNQFSAASVPVYQPPQGGLNIPISSQIEVAPGPTNIATAMGLPAATPVDLKNIPAGPVLPTPPEAKKEERKSGLNPMIRSAGSPARLDYPGLVAETEFPIQTMASLRAARERAAGVDEKAQGEFQAEEAMRRGLFDQDKISAQQVQAQKDYVAAVDRYREQLDQDAEAQSKEAIDPKRIFHGENGTWNQIVTVIGMMFGGMLQARRGGDNPFEKTLDGIMDKDLAEQKFAFESKAKGRAMHQGSLKQDVEKYGSIEAALAKRKADMWDQVGKEAATYRTGAGGAQIQTEANAMGEEAMAQASAYRQKAAEYRAKHTIAASGGGTSVNPAYLTEMERRFPGFQVAWAERVEKLKKGGLTGGQAQQAALAGDWMTDEMRKESVKHMGVSQEQVNKGTDEISKAEVRANIPQKEQSLQRLGAVLATRDPGEVNPAGVGFFKRYVPNWLLTEQGQKNRQEITRAINSYIHDTTGAAMGPAEAERLMEAFLGSINNGVGLEQTMNALEQDVRATRAAIRAGQNPAVAAEYDRRKQAAQEPTPGIQFSPAPQPK